MQAFLCRLPDFKRSEGPLLKTPCIASLDRTMILLIFPRRRMFSLRTMGMERQRVRWRKGESAICLVPPL